MHLINENFDLYDYHHMLGGKIVFSYKGPWDENVLFSVGQIIRSSHIENQKLGHKIFKIFMELAQNVSYYSAEFLHVNDKKVGIGSMVLLQDKNDEYLLHSGNIVNNADIIPIIDKCEVINALDRESLREFKRKQRNLPVGPSGGGNIGLIQIALTSGNPLDIKLTPIDDSTSFFSVCVTIGE